MERRRLLQCFDVDDPVVASAVEDERGNLDRAEPVLDDFLLLGEGVGHVVARGEARDLRDVRGTVADLFQELLQALSGNFRKY